MVAGVGYPRGEYPVPRFMRVTPTSSLRPAAVPMFRASHAAQAPGERVLPRLRSALRSGLECLPHQHAPG